MGMDGRVGKELWMTYQDEYRHWPMVRVCSLEKVTFGLSMSCKPGDGKLVQRIGCTCTGSSLIWTGCQHFYVKTENLYSAVIHQGLSDTNLG